MPRGDAGVGEAQLIKSAQRVTRLNDADAVDAPLGVALDDIHLISLTAQGEGGAQAADATADDQHLHASTSPDRTAHTAARSSISNLDSDTLTPTMTAVNTP